MAELKNQPTAWPTRKLWAVILAGMVVSGFRSGLGEVSPGLAEQLEPLLVEAGPWLQTGLMAAAGYFTRNRA
jgi:hypothetical protein